MVKVREYTSQARSGYQCSYTLRYVEVLLSGVLLHEGRLARLVHALGGLEHLLPSQEQRVRVAAARRLDRGASEVVLVAEVDFANLDGVIGQEVMDDVRHVFALGIEAEDLGSISLGTLRSLSKNCFWDWIRTPPR